MHKHSHTLASTVGFCFASSLLLIAAFQQAYVSSEQSCHVFMKTLHLVPKADAEQYQELSETALESEAAFIQRRLARTLSVAPSQEKIMDALLQRQDMRLKKLHVDFTDKDGGVLQAWDVSAAEHP